MKLSKFFFSQNISNNTFDPLQKKKTFIEVCPTFCERVQNDEKNTCHCVKLYFLKVNKFYKCPWENAYKVLK